MRLPFWLSALPSHPNPHAALHSLLPACLHPQFLAQCGWQLQLATDRARQAAALGLAPELCNFPPFTSERGGAATTNGSAANGEASKQGEVASLFIAATPQAAE